MGSNSKIEWTEATWTPIRARRLDTGKVGVHCERVSPGCKNCYAGRLNQRNLPNHGTGLDFTVIDREKVEVFVDDKILFQPLRWKRPRKIFVCSQTDLFGEFVTGEMVDRVFAVMSLCPQHTFQVLTKRPERMLKWTKRGPEPDYVQYSFSGCLINVAAKRLLVAMGEIPDKDWIPEKNGWVDRFPWLDLSGPMMQWPLPNVWLGVTAENQEWWRKRVSILREIPAAKRFVSAEPLLGDVGNVDLMGIDQVIVGGESGAGARPMHPNWARSLRDQCHAAGVSYFHKQNGEWAPGETVSRNSGIVATAKLIDGEWFFGKEDLARTDGHIDDQPDVYRVGKRAAGRLLDGREWNEFPEVAHVDR